MELAAAPQGPGAASGPGPRSGARGRPAPSAMSWWIGGLFAIGSVCFALGSVPLVLRRRRARPWSRGRSSSGRSSSPAPGTCSTTRRCAAPGGIFGRVRRRRGRLRSLVGWKPRRHRLLGGARPARRHRVLQRHARSRPPQSDLTLAAGSGTWSGRRTSFGSIASSSPAGSRTPRSTAGSCPGRTARSGWRISALNMLGSIAFGVVRDRARATCARPASWPTSRW